MTQHLKKFNKKGGFHPKKLEATGQQLLLRALVNYFGGPTKVARLIGTLNGKRVTLQIPLNWIGRKRVPLEFVGEVSRKLKVDRFALNFEQCGDFMGYTPLWNEVIEALPLPLAVKQKILKLPKPKELLSNEALNKAGMVYVDRLYVVGTPGQS